jgi:hypothetical protein
VIEEIESDSDDEPQVDTTVLQRDCTSAPWVCWNVVGNGAEKLDGVSYVSHDRSPHRRPVLHLRRPLWSLHHANAWLWWTRTAATRRTALQWCRHRPRRSPRHPPSSACGFRSPKRTATTTLKRTPRPLPRLLRPRPPSSRKIWATASSAKGTRPVLWRRTRAAWRSTAPPLPCTAIAQPSI